MGESQDSRECGNLPHPKHMFCAETLERYQRGEQSENSRKWDALQGRSYHYEMLRGTITWSDEDPDIQCPTCMEVLINLTMWRYHLWVASPAGPEDRTCWDTVQREFPEWPGFLRSTMPDYVVPLLEEGQRGTDTLLGRLKRRFGRGRT